ncbi:hypothetical protein AOA12_18785 [Microbacterium sp. No. 7]|nr:hypothetical protein AOA12_18785 [Microbacterium sp. No. 7]
MRWALVRDPRPRRTVRDAAFAAYLRDVRGTVRRPPHRFETIEVRSLARGGHSEIVEIALDATGSGALPGDMLQVWWENPADGHAPGDDASVPHWSTPLPHRPSRRVRATGGELRRRVLDLSAGTPADPSRAPRITPRFYTVSDVTGDELRLQVTRSAAWPERAAAYLHRLQPGAVVRGWVLRHPHRLDRARPALAVVTGSGAAGVFAALRAGARGIHLVWGLGDKGLAPWIERELDGHLASGALDRVELAHAPRRVTDLLAPQLAEARDLVAAGGSVYVSGNSAMADAVDALLTGALGAERARAHAELRYIVSA